MTDFAVHPSSHFMLDGAENLQFQGLNCGTGAVTGGSVHDSFDLEGGF